MNILKQLLNSEQNRIYKTISKEFDSIFYKKYNPELGDIDLIAHYIEYGWKEGQDPAPYFSTNDYMQNNPDVREKNINPFFHYLEYGKSEGRLITKSTQATGPLIKNLIKNLATIHHKEQITKMISPEELDKRILNFFDENYYSSNYPDIVSSNIPPLTHYIKHGWIEKRRPNHWYSDALIATKHLKFSPSTPPFLIYLSTTSEKDLEIHKMRVCSDSGHADCWACNILRPHFHSEYYRKKYNDAHNIDDALSHFCETGWKELRDPSPYFNTSYYLQSYSDVRSANVNPFIHYLTQGIKEGRKPHYDDWVNIKLLQQIKTIDVLSFEYSKITPDLKVQSKEHLFLSLYKNLQEYSGKLVLSISNDNYLKHTGGIQKFVRSESRWAKDSGITYLNICPTRPALALTVNSVSKTFLVNCTAGNEFIGTFTLSEVYETLDDLVAKIPTLNSTAIIHSVMGWNLDLLVQLIRNRMHKTYFYVHDYYSLCPEYRLLRNGIEPCDAPNVKGGICRICVHKSARENYINHFSSLFNSINPHLIFPSETAKSAFVNSGLYKNLTASILPHIDVKIARDSGKHVAEKIVNPNNSNKIRIAYCGSPIGHKGFYHYEKIMDIVRDNNLLEFYHFGSTNTDLNGLIYKKVLLEQGLSSMSSAIKESNIDIVFIGSTWRETFNFIAYEALQSGAAILTLNSSGNVAELVNKYLVGKVVANWQDAARLISDKSLTDMISEWKLAIQRLDFSENKSIFSLDK